MARLQTAPAALAATEAREQIPTVVGDPAYIDVLIRQKQKRLRQALRGSTREKECMKPTVIGHYAFDPHDPVNARRETEMRWPATPHAYLRRIVYCNPASGKRFVFLTTEDELGPGVIALLYLLRWKIEKVFDVFKNKLHHQKAWANERDRRSHPGPSHRSHPQPAHHPPCSWSRRAFAEGEEFERQRAVRRDAQAESRRVPAQEMVRHATQLTCQFIRLSGVFVRPPHPIAQGTAAFPAPA